MESELDVLKSIYDELVIHPIDHNGNDHDSNSVQSAHLDVAVVLARPATVRFDKAPALEEMTYLPPLQARFDLPDAYPEASPPALRLECVWLDEAVLSQLHKACLAFWEPGVEVLYLMVDYLVQSAQDAFGSLDTTTGDTLGPLPDVLFPILNAHQHEARQAIFDAQAFSCEICLDMQAGRNCIALHCGHVFCKACLGEMFSMHIREGAIPLVRCPSCPVAVAKPAEEASYDLAAPDVALRTMPLAILQKIVSADLVTRFQHLARKQALEALPSHTHCPRDWCATALARDPDEKLVVCTSCSYAFCADCARTWHGASEPCRRMKLSFALAEQYLACGEDRAAQTKLERMYGKKNLERLVRDKEDEALADRWRQENAQQCPSCESWVQKAMGCNHMSCIVCKCHFCFLCGDALSSRNPYAHYGDKGLLCYGKLFEGLTGLEDPFGGLEM